MSEEDARLIVLENLHRPFESLEDFHRRVRLDCDVVDALAQAGSLDRLLLLEAQLGLFDTPAAIRQVDRRQNL